MTAVYAGNYTDTMTKAMTAMKGGQPPQLSVLLSTDVFTLMDENAIVPFDGLVADKVWFKDFYPAFMANGQIDGKTWSIPFQRSTIVLYWNKDAFKDAGLDPEKAPASWDEMVAMGKKLVKKDGSGNVTRWGVEIPTTGYAYWMLQALAIENGQKLMNEAGTEVYLTAPKTVAALDYWVDLSRKENVMPTGSIDWATLRTDFLEGKTAMMWHTTGNLTAVKDGAKFNFGVAMLPAKEQRGSPTGGGSFYIFKSASPEQQKAAVNFIQWMTAPEQAAEWSIKTGYVAVSPAAYKTKAMEDYAKGFPAATVARDQLEYAVPELSVHENGRIYKFVNDAVQSAVTGTQKPRQRWRQRSAGRPRAEGLQITGGCRTAASRRPDAHPMTDQAAISPVATRAPRSHAWWNAVNAWLLLLPAAVLLVAFTHYPILATIRHSFFIARTQRHRRSLSASTTTGRCSQDPIFWKALVNNFWFALGTVPTSIALALLMALWVNRNMRGRGFLRLAFFTPTVLPMIAVANIWLFFYTPDYGLLDQLRGLFGPAGLELARRSPHRDGLPDRDGDLEGGRLLHDLLSRGPAAAFARSRGSRGGRGRRPLVPSSAASPFRC